MADADQRRHGREEHERDYADGSLSYLVTRRRELVVVHLGKSPTDQRPPLLTALREIAAGQVSFREDVKNTVTEFIVERRKAGFM
jgi:hypothetical protein